MLLVIVGYIGERLQFVDVALMYAAISFVGTLIIAKYAEREEICSG